MAIDVLKSESPSFVKIISDLKEDGTTAARALLAILINDVVSFFNIGKTMSDVQVAATADLILEDYKTFKPDDFILCFKRAKKGQYGAVYDRIDGQVILKWLSQYEFERSSEIEDFRKSEKSALEKNLLSAGTEVPMPDDVKKIFDNMFKKEPEKKEPTKIVSPEQMLVNRFIAQFDTLWMKRKVESSGRFVKKYGRILNVNEYLEHKFYQLELASSRK